MRYLIAFALMALGSSVAFASSDTTTTTTNGLRYSCEFHAGKGTPACRVFGFIAPSNEIADNDLTHKAFEIKCTNGFEFGDENPRVEFEHGNLIFGAKGSCSERDAWATLMMRHFDLEDCGSASLDHGDDDSDCSFSARLRIGFDHEKGRSLWGHCELRRD